MLTSKSRRMYRSPQITSTLFSPQMNLFIPSNNPMTLGRRIPLPVTTTPKNIPFPKAAKPSIASIPANLSWDQKKLNPRVFRRSFSEKTPPLKCNGDREMEIATGYREPRAAVPESETGLTFIDDRTTFTRRFASRYGIFSSRSIRTSSSPAKTHFIFENVSNRWMSRTPDSRRDLPKFNPLANSPG